MEGAMTGLNREDHALIELGRDGHEPTEGDRARVRASLAGALGATAGLSVTVAVGTSTAAGWLPAAPVIAKAVAVAAVAAVVGAGGVALHRLTARSQAESQTKSPGKSQTAIPLARRPEVPSETLPRVAGETPPVVLDDPTPAMQLGATSPRPQPRTPARPVTAEPGSAEPQESASPATTIEAETRLVRDGIAALRAGDPVRALASFGEHARLYPAGVLAEERTVETMVALRAVGRDREAEAAGTAFLRAHPGSPLAARVREIGGSPSRAETGSLHPNP
jgi:hypothetical protein